MNGKASSKERLLTAIECACAECTTEEAKLAVHISKQLFDSIVQQRLVSQHCLTSLYVQHTNEVRRARLVSLRHETLAAKYDSVPELWDKFHKLLHPDFFREEWERVYLPKLKAWAGHNAENASLTASAADGTGYDANSTFFARFTDAASNSKAGYAFDAPTVCDAVALIALYGTCRKCNHKSMFRCDSLDTHIPARISQLMQYSNETHIFATTTPKRDPTRIHRARSAAQAEGQACRELPRPARNRTQPCFQPCTDSGLHPVDNHKLSC